MCNAPGCQTGVRPLKKRLSGGYGCLPWRWCECFKSTKARLLGWARLAGLLYLLVGWLFVCRSFLISCFPSAYVPWCRLASPARVPLCVFSGRAAGGQLNDRSFTESQVCSVMSQVIRALVYMHETAKICHRDLKVRMCCCGSSL